jgi:hypothetical protein
MLILRIIVFHRRANGEAFAFSYVGEVLRYRLEQILINEGSITQGAQILGDVE